jgi:hypothetical protein
MTRNNRVGSIASGAECSATEDCSTGNICKKIKDFAAESSETEKYQTHICAPADKCLLKKNEIFVINNVEYKAAGAICMMPRPRH